MKRILSATLLTVLSGAVYADDCAFTAQRELSVAAAGASLLKLQTMAGDLRITGVPGLAAVELRGKACASSAETLEKLTLQQKRDGGTIAIHTTAPDEKDISSSGLFDSRYAYIDLEVRLPQALALELQDSSGDVEIAAAGALDISDSSGDLSIVEPRGPVRVRDSSGDIEIKDTQAAVTIVSDSSGDIEIDGVRGDVTVEEDSSGDIEIEKVTGSARVGSDSSGDIRLRNIDGDAEVGVDSSGGIYADSVRGSFRVGRKAGGRSSIEYKNIGGQVSLPEHD